MKIANNIVDFIHKNFLLILLLAYLAAAFAPRLGLFLRNLSFAQISISDTSTLKITPSLLMLSLLLLNAGLGVNIQEIKDLIFKPKLAIIAFLTNIFFPILLIFLIRTVLGLWHNQDELQNLLTGLALIVAMPVAGSSTAWSQNANGNLSLSLGLVLLSTLASPIITPIILHSFSLLTTGDYSEDLHELAVEGTNIFMGIAVVAPSLLGFACHYLFGDKKH